MEVADAELRIKLLNNKVCRFCLNEGDDELLLLDVVDTESQLTPREVIVKFNLIEVNRKKIIAKI